jgi:hypothetical protein
VGEQCQQRRLGEQTRALAIVQLRREKTVIGWRLHAVDPSKRPIHEHGIGGHQSVEIAPILEAAPQARIFGAGQPDADVARAMREGAAAAFGPDAATYGLDQPLEPEDQSAREAVQQAAHCNALRAEMLPGMVEAQRFRDAGLADAAVWARTMTGDGQVVVIAGSGHADRQHGVPALLAVAAPELEVLALGQFEAAPGEGEVFDTVLLAPAPPREDPCSVFDAP